MSVQVELDSISAELGGQRILDDVSLDIDAGEFVTLLGPSGSGKTTTLNVIAGSVRQSGGFVRFGGERVDDVPMHRRQIGIVFQSYALFPHLSVGDNVAYALANRKVPRRERRERVDQMLELVRLPGYAGRPVRSLSGGQQQRVALARALVFNPRVLLLDEPLAALDRQLREAMQVELKRIQREINVTTVGVTHDQVEAMTTADRIAIMNAGRLEQVGTPEELYRRPGTVFVARFLGEANLLAMDGRGQVAGLGPSLPGARGGTAVIRPEDIAVCAADDPACTAEGHVEEVSYQGTRYRLTVVLPAGERLIVSQKPNGSAPPAPGSAVGLRCSIEHVHAIAAAADAEIAAGGVTA
jgi:putative spermidine/putrescine transport system ATP-binding protein